MLPSSDKNNSAVLVEEKLSTYVAERTAAKEGLQRKVAGFGSIISPIGMLIDGVGLAGGNAHWSISLDCA